MSNLSKYIIYAIIGANIIGIFIYNFSGSFKDPKYPNEILASRQEKDNFLKTSSESPIEDKANFQGLSYFEPNEVYKVEAKLSFIQPQEILTVTTSTGEEEDYIKYAWANFKLEGKAYKLLMLKKNLQDPILLLAFTDKTSGSETYGAGRYIEIPHRRGAPRVTIDFNKAFNPYCAYNEKYVCPRPPQENHLPIAMRVGEKMNK